MVQQENEKIILDDLQSNVSVANHLIRFETNATLILHYK